MFGRGGNRASVDGERQREWYHTLMRARRDQREARLADDSLSTAPRNSPSPYMDSNKSYWRMRRMLDRGRRAGETSNGESFAKWNQYGRYLIQFSKIRWLAGGMSEREVQPATLKAFASVEEECVNEELENLTIVCGRKRYTVDKAKAIKLSDFFAAACRSGLRESASGEIDLSIDDHISVRLMVHYLKTGSYPHVRNGEIALNTTQPDSGNSTASVTKQRPASPPSRWQLDNEEVGRVTEPANDVDGRSIAQPGRKWTTSNPDGDRHPNLLIHTRLYALADKFGMFELKEQAKKKFGATVYKHWDHPELVHAAREAFTTTLDDDKGLRDEITDLLFSGDGSVLLQTTAFRQFLLDFPEAGVMPVFWNKKGQMISNLRQGADEVDGGARLTVRLSPERQDPQSPSE